MRFLVGVGVGKRGNGQKNIFADLHVSGHSMNFLPIYEYDI
jgi:hypothetical protein